ncbi:TonB-dependent receptor [Desulfobulbus rhabdoformis]|uniref:TonB-dependent receptor plug domain-containing protein n=1 Tax=Desulfobulbus rhabdoformis TaxID=34032 RepID=UPI001962BEEF|nr:TonB-dependent receptor [Desulfobulbus rhabdoformis]MBM9615531.1 TonB-dependent receptor [Desulfobulbus rhabdoformis]
MQHIFNRKTLSLSACSLLAMYGIVSAETPQNDESFNNVFTLGQITVTDVEEGNNPIGYDSLDKEELYDFNRDSLPEALNLVPGVSMTSGSGNRNESTLSLRGFSRWQVPLTMDGIRLYLPADNRIDFDRFLTPDLSEVQISKGYVSVLNGPDGMGGTINLVTRKPVKEFEGEFRDTISLGNDGKYSGNTVYGNVGGRYEKFYYQASLEQRDVDHWRLSDDYDSTLAEDGGDRDHTDKEDWRTNLKVGFTPNATDEYSLNFMHQAGEKHGIGAVTGTSTVSLWDWPTWDVTSIYYLGHTQLTATTYLNTKLYYNEFSNDLVAYIDLDLTTPKWKSYYDDNAYGASLELGTTAFSHQTLKGALHYRRDNHTEWQTTYSSGFTEPKQDTEEEIYSLALEDTIHLTPKLDLILGISQDQRHTITAEEYRDSLFNQPTKDSSATNYQGALVYRYRDQGKAHFSLSDRTRFPTMFERFSSRFGGALSNPGLDPERALNLEVGISDMLFSTLHYEINLFHNTVDDAMQSVAVEYGGSWYTQYQNVGEATFKGVELAFSTLLTDELELGGNYTYIDAKIDNPEDPNDHLTGTPRHKIFLYGKWTPMEDLQIIPSIEYADQRWSTPADGSSGYVQTGDYTLVNLKIGYQLTDNWDLSLTGRNLLDKNYALSDGYPEEGRNYLMTARYRF